MILEEIRRQYDGLTRNQKRIADLIATSYHQVAFMTATQIANQLLINEATVIRFAQRLGYSGYPDLVASIRGVVQQELEAQSGAADGEDLKGILDDGVRRLERAFASLPRELGQRMIAAIEDAPCTHILAEGMGVHLGGMLAHGLRRLGQRCTHLPGDVASLCQGLARVEPGDLVIGLCVEGSSERIARAIAIARDGGCATLALATSPASPVARAAELSWSFASGQSVDALSVQVLAALIDALLHALALRGGDAMDALGDRIESARSRLSPPTSRTEKAIES